MVAGQAWLGWLDWLDTHAGRQIDHAGVTGFSFKPAREGSGPFLGTVGGRDFHRIPSVPADDHRLYPSCHWAYRRLFLMDHILSKTQQRKHQARDILAVL